MGGLHRDGRASVDNGRSGDGGRHAGGAVRVGEGLSRSGGVGRKHGVVAMAGVVAQVGNALFGGEGVALEVGQQVLSRFGRADGRVLIVVHLRRRARRAPNADFVNRTIEAAQADVAARTYRGRRGGTLRAVDVELGCATAEHQRHAVP